MQLNDEHNFTLFIAWRQVVLTGRREVFRVSAKLDTKLSEACRNQIRRI
jgi:hypothetical protein